MVGGSRFCLELSIFTDFAGLGMTIRSIQMFLFRSLCFRHGCFCLSIVLIWRVEHSRVEHASFDVI